ncbi:PEGA domain-containing protein [Sorangium sp. So ce1151]|uniref:PEGA domain-containing protein n=1 Tax=Sorangium sp. So ce1151 TaxID=3133332 RepID=UPI003F5D9FAA
MRSRRLASSVALSALTTAAGAAAQPAAPPQATPSASAPPQATPPAPAPPQASTPAQSPPASLAETLTGPARADYELGKSLFGNGDFANAFIKFQHAYESSKDARLLWNMVVCTSRMHRYSRLLALVEKLRREDRGVLLPDDWAQIVDLERNARGLVGHLDFAVSEPGAEVTIDGESVGETPLSGKVIVDSGTRRIRVFKPGFKEHVLMETVTAGQELLVEVRLLKQVHAGRLSVLASPGDVIALDGKLLGRGRWDGAVPSGRHVLRVTAPGMVPYESEFVIQDEALSSAIVGLKPVEKAGVPAWAWVAGSALLVAAAVVLVALPLQPGPEPPIKGTLGETRPTGFGGRW